MSEQQKPGTASSRPNMNAPYPGDRRAMPHKPSPSPLQVSQLSTPTKDESLRTRPAETESPQSARDASSPLYSPRSPHTSPPVFHDPSRLPRERPEEIPPVQTSDSGKTPQPPQVRTFSQSSSHPSAREDAYRQVRTVSSPTLTTNARAGSPAQFPSELAHPKVRMPLGAPDVHPVIRTSSIDSTVSSVSSMASTSLSQDPQSPLPSEIAHLIAAAGSPEAAIYQLLKEKKYSANQSSQLWTLVKKQRTLVLGLNKDLERALHDKDKYQQRLKDFIAQSSVPPVTPPENLRITPEAKTITPVQSDSEDELPIQRHSVVTEEVKGTTSGKNETPQKGIEQVSAMDPSVTSARDSQQTSTPSPSAHTSIGTSSMQAALSKPGHTSTTSIDTQPPMTPIQPLEIHKRTKLGAEEEAASTTTELDNRSSHGSFTARRSLTTPRKPSVPIPDPSQVTDEPITISPVTRKGPPTPLNLGRPFPVPQPQVPHASQASQAQVVQAQIPQIRGATDLLVEDENSGSDYEDLLEIDETPAFERGRKKTREDDDKERETILIKEQESRSLSKKSANSKSGLQSPASKQAMPKSPAIRSFAPQESLNPSTSQGPFSPSGSLADMLSLPTSTPNSASERSILSSRPPLSPGLPVSPRPIDRPINSPSPRQQREGGITQLSSPPLSSRSVVSPPSLSVRAPRHAIPLPPHTPRSAASQEFSPASAEKPGIGLTRASTNDSTVSPRTRVAPEESLQTSDPNSSHHESRVGGVYRGLVSENYPDLLLPPNALPSIIVKVTSSRLKPSRYSTLALKGPEEDQVFTLGISARSDMMQLWRVEKPIMSLPELDNQLKRASPFTVKLPDRSLFVGHAPAKIDARRAALEKYFEEILDTAMNERAAVLICQFLSTQVIESEEHDTMVKSGSNQAPSALNFGLDGRIVKEGFLTKRGKNFGGWKARFFVLDEPVLRYYESPGGSLLGTIKLQHAQIGRQSAHQAPHSPAFDGQESDNPFRHAFLILEPKRKDSSSLVRHVLCAESDSERDEWVVALLQYVGGQSVQSDDKSRPSTARTEASSKKSLLQTIKKPSAKEEAVTEINEPDAKDALQGTSYEDTVAAQAPLSVTSRRQAETPTQMDQIMAQNQTYIQNQRGISKPTNGTVIQDGGAWGMRPMDSPRPKEKEQKKRGMWGFREKISDAVTNHSNASEATLPRPRLNNVRAVFGIPLAEAVEHCMAPGTDVCLPAVVYRCLEYLEAKDAASEEGIFRLSGSNVVIKAFRERFNVEGDVDFMAEKDYCDVHAVASLLKMYLRELPYTVLTRELHVDFLQVLELEDKAKKIAAYNALVHKLPLPNWTLIRALSAFLIGVVNNSGVNKMSVRNVGIVFSPTLNIPAPMFAAFLTDFDSIFGAEPEEAQSVLSEIRATSPLTPEDIRSPRHQIFSDIPTPSHHQDSFQQPGGLGLTYEKVLHDSHREHDTGGFISLQPSYDSASVGSRPTQDQRKSSITMPGPEYGAFQRSTTPVGLGATGIMRDTKARRRESSMLLMGMGGAGNRKSSMPTLKNPFEQTLPDSGSREY